MKVNIVCYEDTKSWILGKFALKLEEELLKLPGMTVKVSDRQDQGFDINHHIIYIASFDPSGTRASTMVTHVDSLRKIIRVRRLIAKGVLCICMSEHTRAQLIGFGCDPEYLKVALPPHDFAIKRRKTNLLITSRLYPDARKNESDLLDLAKELSPECFTFTIMGAGWDQQIRELKGLGYECIYYSDFDRPLYENLFSVADYFLYLGYDEGSMGYLDALHAGVTPIVTKQGFHHDLASEHTLLFEGFDELLTLLKKIQDRGLSLNASVRDLSWAKYAQDHHELWLKILKNQRPPIPRPSRGWAQILKYFFSRH